MSKREFDPEYDCSRASYPTCPYCGHVDLDPCDLSVRNDDDTTETECGQCEKTYTVTLHIDYAYTTKKVTSNNDCEG